MYTLTVSKHAHGWKPMCMFVQLVKGGWKSLISSCVCSLRRPGDSDNRCKEVESKDESDNDSAARCLPFSLSIMIIIIIIIITIKEERKSDKERELVAGSEEVSAQSLYSSLIRGISVEEKLYKKQEKAIDEGQ
uniref:Uncharacterized protein n=1 Tax=Trypanosoma vivax (strain Y486) TaxID=1055687 RepID=G0U3M5_TRYVY|nr:hypothetical protein, unlikely [Trypanosoma vivax Y486]